MAEQIPVPSIGDIAVPGKLSLTGGAGGSAQGGTSNIGVNFGNTNVSGKDQTTMLVLGAVALAFLFISHK